MSEELITVFGSKTSEYLKENKPYRVTKKHAETLIKSGYATYELVKVEETETKTENVKSSNKSKGKN